MGFIVIGYHYTTETNSKYILEHGLHPRDLSEIEHCFDEYLDIKDKCIWVFTTPKSDEELTMVLLDVLSRQEDFKIVCLRVIYPRANSVRHRYLTKEQKLDSTVEEVKLNHTICCGMMNRRSPFDLATKTIPPNQIDLVGLWDFTKLDKIMETR